MAASSCVCSGVLSTSQKMVPRAESSTMRPFGAHCVAGVGIDFGPLSRSLALGCSFVDVIVGREDMGLVIRA